MHTSLMCPLVEGVRNVSTGERGTNKCEKERWIRIIFLLNCRGTQYANKAALIQYSNDFIYFIRHAKLAVGCVNE